MYLIKQIGEDVSAQELEVNDVIAVSKKWYVITEKLGLEDKLQMRGLRNGVNYTIDAVKSFGTVRDFRKIGRVTKDRWVEDLSKDIRLKELLEEKIQENKENGKLLN
ncbi:MAG: hypothetical protein SLAVMIC_00009 [uncultured marine phage]|uniref:Uncharacterized protein n=1 Tax=uncultured marine phage TaxID=707152 RepID=A0A8D9FR75_9VIRU|nr:MAG: hypothetical protein SLAVMIC_00009 [uncultured marine phage]